MHRIAVVGTIYREYCGVPLKPLTAGASGDGRISAAVSGGGRNIARTLRQLGEEVIFITAVGEDPDSFSIMEECEQAGLNTDYAVSVSGETMPKRLLITSTNGTMEQAVYDRHALRALNREFFLMHCMEVLSEVDAIVMDGDLPAEGLQFLADTFRVPLFCDPGSLENAGKIRPILSKLFAIKPDLNEAFALSAARERNTAAERILKMGTENLFLSQGANGMYAVNQDGQSIQVPCKPAFLENALGVGDAMSAAMVWGCLNGLSLSQTAEAAMRAASMTASSKANINPDLTAAKLR
jgi:pseudouridine kinase